MGRKDILRLERYNASPYLEVDSMTVKQYGQFMCDYIKSGQQVIVDAEWLQQYFRDAELDKRMLKQANEKLGLLNSVVEDRKKLIYLDVRA